MVTENPWMNGGYMWGTQKGRTCSIPNCVRPMRTRGWCNTHYQRWRIHGDPLMGEKRRKFCKVEGCSKGAHGHGWCDKHYRRWKLYGDPLAYSPNKLEPDEAIKVRVEPQGDCLVWLGAKDPDGYGTIVVNGKSRRLSRYVHEREHGKIPSGLVVRHKCDNPSCIKLDHLELGTPKDNWQDMVDRGRAPWQNVPKGESGAEEFRAEQSRDDDLMEADW